MLEAEQIFNERYQLKRKLAENVGRQTWQAEDLQSQPTELVVLKFLPFGGQMQWNDLKLFEREAEVLKHLEHPRIPKYRDYFNIDDRTLWFCLVQEYIPGSSLKELSERGKIFTESEIVKIAEQVLEILIHLHELNPRVLHRDIKPSNLILNENNQIYLIDFGAVQNRTATEGASFTVVGTYGYAPMEQFGGRSVPASDLYSLGATLIYLLTGTSPSNLPQENLRIKFADRVTISKSLVDWISKLTEPAVEKRFSNARQALSALKYKENLINRRRTYLVDKSTFINNSGCGSLFDSSVKVPKEIQGWNWGAFMIPWFWSASNQVWIGLLVIFFNWPYAILLGIKGNEWAWKSRRWNSISHFKAHQRNWTIAGVIFWTLVIFCFASAF
ncbi:MAG: serine/threonine protein kinase [Moorea sp. SIO2B7]|nr:serine/threonine protein kinase [Moorena sp. SIO2B7]